MKAIYDLVEDQARYYLDKSDEREGVDAEKFDRWLMDALELMKGLRAVIDRYEELEARRG